MTRDAAHFTAKPSYVVHSVDAKGSPTVCHSFITDNVFDFLTDCTHALAGQKVRIPPESVHLR